MARFFNDDSNAPDAVANAHRSFSILVFAGMSAMDMTAESLAERLNVDTDDVYNWLHRKALPSRKLVYRAQNLFRGDTYYATTHNDHVYNTPIVQESSWTKVIELIQEVENIQALLGVHLTHPKGE